MAQLKKSQAAPLPGRATCIIECVQQIMCPYCLTVFIELCLRLGKTTHTASFDDLGSSLYDAFDDILPENKKPSSPEGYFAVWKENVYLPTVSLLSEFGKPNDKVEIELQRGTSNSLFYSVLI